MIGIVTAGTARVSFTSRGRTENATFQPRHLAIIPDRMPLSVDLQTSIGSTHLYLRRSVLEEVAEGMGGRDPATLELIANCSVLDPILEHLILAMSVAITHDPTASALYIDHIARALATHLIQKHSTIGERRKPVPRSGLSSKQVDQMRQIVEDRLSERLTLADLTASSGMSADHFIRLFKRSTGMTPYRFIIQCRVNRAGQLLAKTAMPINAIALECGFGDQIHLTKAFGRLVGSSPASFRKNSKK